MKLVTFIGMALLGFAIVSCSGSEERKIEKRIEVTSDNGETELQITTTEDGVTKEENFTGQEAEQKLKEIEKEADKLSKESSDTKKVIVKKEMIEEGH